MARDIHDHYFREAKREGYLSRAAFKLIEIDDRRRILRRGDRVLDCGAAPGSWVQIAAQRVGERGLVVGVDLQPVDHRAGGPSVRLVQGDVREIPAETLAGHGDAPRAFDVVLSDMAPNTTGDRTIDHHESIRLCHALLDRCGVLLREGGNLVMKVFEGEAYPDLLDRAGLLFERARGFKPKASRSISREMYVVAHGYRGPGAEPPRPTPPRPRPAPGWGPRDDRA